MRAHVPFTVADTRHNLRWYILYRVIIDFSLWIPVWMLFLRKDIGLSFTTIMMLELYFQTLITVLEIPTGMVADAIGRKWSLAAGAVALTIAVGALGMATPDNWFPWFLTSWTVWAFAATFINGADAALVYESLLASERGEEFADWLGRVTTIVLAAMVGAMFIGGRLGEYGYRVPILVHAAILPVAIFAALRLREPPRAGNRAPARPGEIVREMRGLLRTSARFNILLGYSADDPHHRVHRRILRPTASRRSGVAAKPDRRCAGRHHPRRRGGGRSSSPGSAQNTGTCGLSGRSPRSRALSLSPSSASKGRSC